MSDLVQLRGGQPFSSLTRDQPVGRLTKRVIDIVLALAALLLLAPLFILCFAAISIASPGPVFFKHRRIGFQGKPFGCLKFRTMMTNSDERLREYLSANPDANAEWISARKLRFDPRVTSIGHLLRKTSLDELPQIFNVFKGDMSIVGPRPVTEEELLRYSTSVQAYYACRPGITGLWQVSGRSSTTYDMRVAYDSFYSRHWSLMLDTKIILVTVPALLNSDNAY
ncbi:MAG: sugar transferase [Xanthobacteraceae bacterium]|nr:sugar transferase [Xanthobacteraceae bacterium]